MSWLIAQADAKRIPLAIDLFCGLGGWADGLLSEGWTVIGFDIERWSYPGQLVIQDVQTLHGCQFKNTDLIVASPPCQAYSYRAMPWKRAKALGPPDNTLFETCFRIQREASEAAGHKIPMIVENVKGAQKWVGRAKWHYGSYYLWGDVPALMPITLPRQVMKSGVTHRSDGATNFHGFKTQGMNWSNRELKGQDFTRIAGQQAATKNGGNGTWFGKSHGRDYPGQPGNGRDGIKQGGEWWSDPNGLRQFSSHSNARKQASAMIAKIPFPLAQHIARVFKPISVGDAPLLAQGREANEEEGTPYLSQVSHS